MPIDNAQFVVPDSIERPSFDSVETYAEARDSFDSRISLQEEARPATYIDDAAEHDARVAAVSAAESSAPEQVRYSPEATRLFVDSVSKNLAATRANVVALQPQSTIEALRDRAA